MDQGGPPRSAGIRPAHRPVRPRPDHPADLLPRHRRAVRRDRHRIADGRAPHGLVHGHGARAQFRVHARSIRRAVDDRPAGERVDGARARAGALGADGRGSRRIGYRRGARVHDGDRSDCGAPRARDRSGTQAGRPADSCRPPDGPAPDGHVECHRDGRRLDRDGRCNFMSPAPSTGTASSRASTCRTSGWASSSRSFSASRS